MSSNDCPTCFQKEHRPDMHVASTYHRRINDGLNERCASCGELWPCETRQWYDEQAYNAESDWIADLAKEAQTNDQV